MDDTPDDTPRDTPGDTPGDRRNEADTGDAVGPSPAGPPDSLARPPHPTPPDGAVASRHVGTTDDVVRARARTDVSPTMPGGRRIVGGDDQPSPWLGAHTATVTDVLDPDGDGRVKVAIPPPRPRGRTITAWARVATLMAGADRGTWFPPAVGDEVIVAFDRGDQNRPLVIGSLWSQQAPPPEDDPAAQVRRFRSRSGAEIEFDDGPSAHVTLRTPGGGHVELDDDAGRILIGDDNGNAVVMDATGITIETASTVRVEGSGTVEVVAGLVKVEAGMTHFSGVVQADTVIATNVLASTISPSAGNAW